MFVDMLKSVLPKSVTEVIEKIADEKGGDFKEFVKRAVDKNEDINPNIILKELLSGNVMKVVEMVKKPIYSELKRIAITKIIKTNVSKEFRKDLDDMGSGF